mgnify:CR=1 FL=1
MSRHKQVGGNMRCRLLAFAILAISATASVQAQVSKPPASRVDNVRETMHGVEIIDPYRWLEDQENAETRAWINTQNKYTHSLLDELPLRELQRLEERLVELTVEKELPEPRRGAVEVVLHRERRHPPRVPARRAFLLACRAPR